LRGKADADVEGLAILADGAALVAFERRHRLLRFEPRVGSVDGGLAGVPRVVATPPELAAAPRNGGVEAMAALPDGGLLLITEEMVGRDGAMVGWRWMRFHYPVRGGFRPTGAAALPDGGIVVVERSFDPLRGWRVRLARVAAVALAAAAAGDTLVAIEEIGRLETPWVVENIEGVAARRGPRGETLLWLLSDDDFNPLQRTVLLHFELAPR
ncbi:MAG: esterase-like activity of phytase family protein, partial [Rhodospirillales bacterium]|nr:esterase-like activity of phytase family protein [Rhodospirillales bacterium]